VQLGSTPAQHANWRKKLLVEGFAEWDLGKQSTLSQITHKEFFMNGYYGPKKLL